MTEQTETQMPELKPCPFCKPLRVLVHVDTTVYDVPEDEDYLGAKSKRVCCGNCGCKGRKGKTREDAIRLWNTRAEPAKQTVVADGMPEQIYAWYPVLTDCEIFASKYPHKDPAVQYTRSYLCPPADVIKQVAGSLQTVLDCYEYDDGIHIYPMTKEQKSEGIENGLIWDVKQALALLQPYLGKGE